MSLNKTTSKKSKLEAAVSSGKRRLDFEDGSRALKNKTFFLDLPGHKNLGQLEKQLTMRGGKIEKFFHRGVKYLITNRCRDESRSTPSPLTPGGMAVKSPFESLSPNDAGSKPVALGTRAAMMLAASQKKAGSKKSGDVVSMAKSWGCKVFSLETLLSELKKLKPLPKSAGEKSRAPCGRVHGLTQPFLKVEDHSRGYRPLIHETKKWPRPRHTTSPGGCPFDTSRVIKSSGRVRSSRGSPSPSKRRSGGPHPMLTRHKKPGYCECCSVKYKDLRMHLRSGKHMEYASTESNFASLDRLISRGTRFAEFVSRLKTKRRSPESQSPRRSPRGDAVILVTPPSPSQPTTPQNRTTPTRALPAKRLQSPRGRRSPRLHLSTNGITLRPSPQKTITLQAGSFSSPKTGELKITPVKGGAVGQREHTPGFRPVKGSRIEAIAQQLSKSSGVSRKRQREMGSEQVSRKRARYDEEFVPETPEKPVTRSAITKKLCNLDTVFDRVGCHTPRSSPRGSPSTSVTSPRKSLMEKLNRTRRARRSSSRPKRLLVSFRLRPLQTRHATPTTKSSVSNGITPEIALQCRARGSNCKCGKMVPESPLTDFMSRRVFESSDSETPFGGFSSSGARRALAQVARGRGPASSPLTRSALSIGSHLSRKRVRSEGDDVCLSNVISPASKRRRVAARRSPRRH